MYYQKEVIHLKSVSYVRLGQTHKYETERDYHTYIKGLERK